MGKNYADKTFFFKIFLGWLCFKVFELVFVGLNFEYVAIYI